MKNAINKIIYISLFTIISCANTSKFCKHNSASNINQFSYRTSTGKETQSNTFQFANEINDKTWSEVQPLTWQDLSAVTYEIKFNKQYNMDFKYPVFGHALKKLQGKEFYITGHVIPLDVNQGLYAVSKNPYSSCYFCGKSGPESVVSLKFKEKPSKYKMDMVKTFKGILKLNDSNPMDFIYLFTGTEEYNITQ